MLIGVDVSKETLVWCALDTKPANLRNESLAIAAWLATLPAGTTVAMEATGRYHRLLANLAVAHGCRVLVLNPSDVHHYAKSLTPRATTDPIMAQVIAQYVASARGLHDYQPVPAYVAQVRTLMGLRLGLVTEKVRLGHQRREAPELATFVDPLLTEVRAAIQQVTASIEKLVNARSEFAGLVSVPGFGALTSAYLLVLLATHAFRSSDAFVAFVGLDLRIKDSGKERKRHVLTKRGDPEARRLLFLAARVAGLMKDTPFQKIR